MAEPSEVEKLSEQEREEEGREGGQAALQIEEGAPQEVKTEEVNVEEVKAEEAKAQVVKGESEEVAEEAEEEGRVEMEEDRDSLVPGTGSINGDLEEEESDEGEEEEEEEEENMSNMVQGTTETLLNKLEENLSQAPPCSEQELLQVPAPSQPPPSPLIIPSCLTASFLPCPLTPSPAGG